MSIRTYTLENGMQVLLEEDRSARVVSFNVLVKVGSANETDDEAGLCHVIEHMLFKGTPTRPAGAIARDVEASGGEINAYTSIDQTVFYINMASRFSDRGLSILADAIMNPLFDAEELEREKEVILEEIRREQDNPGRMVNEHLFQEVFKTHTYGRPIIGFPETVRSFTRGRTAEFYRRWYTPHNMVFIAVGDFECERMLADIRKAFAGFEGLPVPAQSLPQEPAQKKPRVLIKTMNIQSAYLSLGFHIPAITHEDVPAVDVLSHILGGADSSRLEQEVKEHARLVHSIYAYAFTPKEPGVLAIGAKLKDRDVVKAIEAIKRTVEKTGRAPVTSEELSRAKLNIRSHEIYEKETVGGQASKIAHFLATAGSHEFEERYYAMLSEVRAETVMDVARRYLSFSGASAVLLLPEKSPMAGYKKALEKALSHPAPSRPKATAGSGGGTERIKLKCGATLIVRENHKLPIVSVCAASLGGTRYENRVTNGISVLMSRAMTKGTVSRDAVEVARDIEKLAGNVDGFSGRNTMGLRSEFLSDHLEDGFRLFGEILAHPSFEQDEVAKERRLQLRAIKDQEDALSSLAFAELLKNLYPKHPYGLRALGRSETVRKLTRAHLARLHRAIFRAGNIAIAVVGDVSRQEVVRLAEEILSELPGGKSKPPRISPDIRPKKPRETATIRRGKQQAHIAMGFMSTTFSGADRYPMIVLNNILAGQGGRLFINLRDKMSLAYSVSSVNHDGIEPGYFAVYIGTDPSKERKAVDGILAELSLITSERVSSEELERSKQHLVGTYELDLQRSTTVAGLYTFNELYGLPMQAIERYPQRILDVTAEDILRVAKKYITPESYTLSIVKPS